MSSFNLKNVSFKRIDGSISPVLNCDIGKSSVIFYENPAVSSSGDFELDVLRYALRCVYAKEALFPCVFNIEVENKKGMKVFFDKVLKNEYKREFIEKLVYGLYHKNTSPYIFKALGIFEQSKDFNCVVSSYSNGETFISSIRDIKKGEILTVSHRINIPMLECTDSDMFETMSLVEFSDVSLFNDVLSCRKDAVSLKPSIPVYRIEDRLDGYLKKSLDKYRFDLGTGIISFYEKMEDIKKPSVEDVVDVEKLEQKYTELMLKLDN